VGVVVRIHLAPPRNTRPKLKCDSPAHKGEGSPPSLRLGKSIHNEGVLDP